MQYDGLNAWKQKRLPDPDKQKAVSFSTKMSGSNNGTPVNSIKYMEGYHQQNPVGRDEWRTNPDIYTSQAHPLLTKHGFAKIDPYTQKPYENPKRGGGKNKSKTKSNRRKLIGGKNATKRKRKIKLTKKKKGKTMKKRKN